MANGNVATATSMSTTKASAKKKERLYYLDWLRVLAILGVFLFHTLRPFDEIPWEINNSENSVLATLLFLLFLPWGMPLFFFLSGSGAWFALRRRTASQFAVERVHRLLIPFIVGCFLLSTIQFYYQWLHLTQTGAFVGTLEEFFVRRMVSFGPRLFGWAGYHLWFLGFLFIYSLIALPLFMWFKRDSGRRVIDLLARTGQRRGGLIVFVIPLVLIQLSLRPNFGAYGDWADFVTMLSFFVIGYILYADERFATVVWRDWPLWLAAGVLSTLFILVGAAGGIATEWMDSPGTPGYYLAWTIWGISGWCWPLFILYVGMRYLNFTNRWLVYGQETILPFYLLHHPVIIVIAFYVVQWNVGITLKYLVVLISSLLVTLGLIELVIKRINALRGFFGMKDRIPDIPSTKTV